MEKRAALKLFLILIFLTAALSASTAYACGCGIYIPREGDANVAQERALVRWDGQREDIVMSLGVLGGSKEAAIILPIPSRAEVKLADANLFDELNELTKPRVQEEIEWVFNFGLGASATPPEAVGAGAPPVTVLSRQNVGPFDVANLAATDSNALKNWLAENGFQLDPGVIALMTPYVEENWTFVAVRLRPDQASQQLSGNLAPLWIAFDSGKLVYPMRASANADNSQSLLLYLLADHRVDKANAFGASHVSYADWVEPSALASASTLRSFVPRKLFLTKFTDTVNPKQVNDDFQFSFAAQDTAVHEITVRRVKQDATGFVLLGCFAFAVLILFMVMVVGIFITRRRRSPSAIA
jgi:hypothetical protein